MKSIPNLRQITSRSIPLVALGAASLAACGGDTSGAEGASLGVVQSRIAVPDDALATTLAPLRTLDIPGDVYFQSIDETFPESGTFSHVLHVYQPDDNGEGIRFELRATTSSGSVDPSHTFRSVRLTTHPGEVDEVQQSLPDAGGQHTYALTTSTPGWYRLDFEYGAPNAGRTLGIWATDAQGNPLKIASCDPAGANVDVRATVAVEAESNAFLKGGAFRDASASAYAYVDEVRVDGNRLYRRGFDQGLFAYPLGRLPASSHVLQFSLRTSGASPSYSWFGVSEQSYDPAGTKTEWDRVQLLYRGPMHTADYDAWSDGVAFAQGPALARGVRPPPVRRGTAFGLALEDSRVSGSYQNATVRVYPYGSSTPTGWSATRAADGDYAGGIMTPGGFSSRSREHWNVTVPADAAVGRYVVRATAPGGARIGSDVLIYVIHNPYQFVASGALAKSELETFGYDEDEDGAKVSGGYGPDQDTARDNFTALYYGDPDYGYSLTTKLTAAFRRTHAADSYSMLDYAMAVTDGTASEFESMRRLYRIVSQRLRYTHYDPRGDSSGTFLGSGDGLYFSVEDARLASQPGQELASTVGGQCQDYSSILAALARTSGIVARVASSHAGLGGWGEHYFTEVFVPNLPYHGGETAPSGGPLSDSDPWYVFDATDPHSTRTGTEALALWPYHGESISPRALYGRAMATISPYAPTGPWNVVTTRLEWDPFAEGYVPVDEVLWVGDAYSSGPEYWLTEDSIQGWLGFGEKDVFRVNKEATGASAVRVRALLSNGEQLAPALCVAPASAEPPAIPEMCAEPSSTVELASGDSYVLVFNVEANPSSGEWGYTRQLRGESIRYELELVSEDETCTEATAVDMGVPGTATTVANDGCLKLTQYPSWWGNRPMLLMSGTPGSYPIPFDWTNCPGSAGSAEFTRDWQSLFVGGISAQCTTLLNLKGDGNGTVRLHYWGT